LSSIMGTWNCEEKIIKHESVLNDSEAVMAEPSNEELIEQVRRLREEITQLREVVNALFTAVFDEYEEESDQAPRRDEFNIYN